MEPAKNLISISNIYIIHYARFSTNTAIPLKLSGLWFWFFDIMEVSMEVETEDGLPSKRIFFL